jgi:heme-degrading monooxygenase HmoA
MVIREWRGRVGRSRSAEYPRHFRTAVLPELRGIGGFLGALLTERREGNQVEFLVLTRWVSMHAIQIFAGADPDQAVVEPGAIVALDDYDKTVRHYEVLEDVSSA